MFGFLSNRAKDAFSNPKLQILHNHIAQSENEQEISRLDLRARASEQAYRLSNDLSSAGTRALYTIGGLAVTSTLSISAAFVTFKLGLLGLPLTLALGGAATFFTVSAGLDWARQRANEYDTYLEDRLIADRIKHLVTHVEKLPNENADKAILKTLIYGQQGPNGNLNGQPDVTTEDMRKVLTRHYRKYLNKHKKGFLQSRSILGNIGAFTAGVFVDIARSTVSFLGNTADKFATQGYKEGFIQKGIDIGKFYGDRLGFVTGLVGMPYLYSTLPGLSSLITLPMWFGPAAWLGVGLFGSFAGSKLGRNIGTYLGKQTSTALFNATNYVVVKPYNLLGFGGYPASAAFLYCAAVGTVSLPAWGLALGTAGSFFAGSWIGKKLYQPVESINRWLTARGLMGSTTPKGEAEEEPAQLVNGDLAPEQSAADTVAPQPKTRSWMPSLSSITSRLPSLRSLVRQDNAEGTTSQRIQIPSCRLQ